jgi:putative ABC transport system permease protein
MRVVRHLTSLWNTVFRGATLDRELDDEIRATIETLTARYVEGGMSVDAATRAAWADLGGTSGIVQVRENVRDGRVGAALEALSVDLRYAWRGLRKAPGLLAVVVATLALGIGANTAIFSIVHAMLLAPLPYRHADRLAMIWLDKSDAGYPRSPLGGPDLRDLQNGTRTFDAFGGIWASGTRALTGDHPPEQLRGALVTTNFFDVLGASAALGRTFRDGDADEGPTVVLGWELFERRFDADPSILGRTILIDDTPTTVIGVLPRSFRLLLPLDSSVPDDLQIWQPFWRGFDTSPRGHLFLRVVGRMREGVTVSAARADVDAVARRLTDESGEGRTFTTAALHADGVREIRAPLLALFAGVAILLTIACVNVASLLIARAVSRTREMTLRIALGASRGRLVRQSLIEGLLLTGLGAVAGVVAGAAGLQILVAFAPDSLERIRASSINGPVLAFTVVLSLLWGVLLSLAPVAQFLTARPHAAIGGRRPLRYATRAAFVVSQIALSLVLLVGAGLLVRAFTYVQRVDPGFQTDGRFVLRVALSEARYSTPAALVAASNEVRRRLATIPGVTAVGAISHLPYDDLPNWYLTYSGIGVRSHGPLARADARAISPGLLATLGVELVDGEVDHERDAERIGVVVDDMLARRLWPGGPAVGREFLAGQGTPELRMTVVGVVRHLRLRSLVDDLTPQIFIPFEKWQRNPMTYVVQSPRDASGLTADIRAAIASFDPNLPISDVRPLHQYVASARSMRRFTMLLAVSFAACAIALTSVGLFGVLAYTVATRRREFGVRRALGADTRQVLGEIVREGMLFAAAGSAGGLVAAVLATRFLEGQLYAVDPRDPATYAASLALVLASAVLACGIPAHRALSISPLDATRNSDV